MKAKSDYDQVLNMPKEMLQSRSKVHEDSASDEMEHTHHEHSHSDQCKQVHMQVMDEDDESATAIMERDEMDEPVRRPLKTSIFSKVAADGAMAGSSGASGNQQQLVLFANQQQALIQKKNTLLMPKPQWHPPWKLYRVISGHLGWVRCIDVDPSNEWFVTGATDRIIKVDFTVT